tara:strand:- start:8976 stop:9320 length:345 start_codon:yes stop_codon:yes gene_type:complete
MIELPLNSSPEQLFSVTIGDNSYDCRVTLNSRSGVWSISLSLLGVSLVEGVALLGGVDIFSQYKIPITNAYIINLDNSTLDPTPDNLGTSVRLVIFTDEEIAEASQGISTTPEV